MPPSEGTASTPAATEAGGTEDAGIGGHDLKALAEEAESTSLSLESITDGKSERGIPQVKFIDDIGTFSESFNPPASPELLIGAFSDLFSKFKGVEQSLSQKRKSNILIECYFFVLIVVALSFMNWQILFLRLMK